MILVAFGLVLVIEVGLLFGYAQIKQTLARKSVEQSLIRESARQTDSLLPSFLVPEQRAGIEVLLKRFRVQEGLEDVRIVQTASDLPEQLATCQLGSSPQVCMSTDHRKIALTAPIGDPRQGYLLKVIPMPNPLAGDYLLQIIEITTAILLVCFFCLFLILTRATTQELPRELNSLAAWIESVLTDKSYPKQPQLRLAELNSLGSQIAEIIERHHRAQDHAVVGQVASGIIHDIKTPLHSIVTAMALAEEQLPDSPKRLSRLESLLKVCKVNLPLMGAIIETTLDGSREIHLETKADDLRKTVQAALTAQETQLRQRGINLTTELGDHALAIEHDSVQLGRVFSNVLKNAIEAVSRGPSPAIHVSMRVADSSEAFVSVEDNGPGLPGSPSSVFRAFRSSKPRGTGLGLLVSKKIIEAHRGALHAGHSERLGGARFDIVLQTAIPRGGSK
jgi:signal transduction histidine kinase